MRVVPPSMLPDVGAKLVTTAASKYLKAASDSTLGDAKSSLLAVTATVADEVEGGEKHDKVVLEMYVASTAVLPNMHLSPRLSTKFLPDTTTFVLPARRPECGDTEVTEGGGRSVRGTDAVE